MWQGNLAHATSPEEPTSASAAGTFNFSTSLVRFAAVARIVVCSQGASGRESPDRPAAEKSRREISVSRPDFWYNIGVLRAWATML